jgi:hypothetical protein
VIQIEKFAQNQAANSSKFLDHHTSASFQPMEAIGVAELPFSRAAARTWRRECATTAWVIRPNAAVLLGQAARGAIT